jgi:hypothetical protein
MKAKFKSIISVTAMGIALALGCYSGQAAGVTVVVSPPVVMTPVPDSYVWDGSEYVGVVGSQYYYLGPGNVWMAMDTPRLHRFQSWQRGHQDWRAHATHNVRYRNGYRGGGPQPMHGAGHSPNPNKIFQPGVNPGQYGLPN